MKPLALSLANSLGLPDSQTYSHPYAGTTITGAFDARMVVNVISSAIPKANLAIISAVAGAITITSAASAQGDMFDAPFRSQIKYTGNDGPAGYRAEG